MSPLTDDADDTGPLNDAEAMVAAKRAEDQAKLDAAAAKRAARKVEMAERKAAKAAAAGGGAPEAKPEKAKPAKKGKLDAVSDEDMPDEIRNGTKLQQLKWRKAKSREMEVGGGKDSKA